MKVKIASKNEFDKWLSAFRRRAASPYGEDETWSTDFAAAFQSPFSPHWQTVDVCHTDSLAHILSQLPQNDTEAPARQGMPTTHTREQPRGDDAFERVLYCPSVSPHELEPAKTLEDYGITEADVFLYGVYRRPFADGMSYRATLWRDMTDFAMIVRERADFEVEGKPLFKPPPPPKGVSRSWLASWAVGSTMLGAGLRPIEGVVLYTDEDHHVATYMRLNFTALDAMTGHHLNLYVFEDPTRIEGVSPGTYWKSRLSEKAYVLLSLLGWTRSKPYGKQQCYDIAHILRIPTTEMPCVVLLGDISSDQKIVLPLRRDVSGFFRQLSSTIASMADKMLKESKKWPGFDVFAKDLAVKWQACENHPHRGSLHHTGTSASEATAKVFISYSTADSELAMGISETLSRQGVSSFLAEKSIPPGTVWEEEIHFALIQASIIVVILTPQSVNSRWVMCEAGAAWALGKTVIPAVFNVKTADLPEPISKYQSIDIACDAGFRSLCEQVSRAGCRG